MRDKIIQGYFTFNLANFTHLEIMMYGSYGNQKYEDN